jgi:hypothetical protein
MHTNAERVPSRGQCAYEPQRIVPERQLPSEARALACAGRVQCLRSGTGTSRSGVLPTNSERDRLSGRWQAPALAFAVMSPTLYNVFRRHMNWRQCALLPAAFADRARLPLDLKRCARDSGRALSLRAQQSLPQNTLYNVFRRHMNWRQCALLPAAFADRARLPLDLCARLGTRSQSESSAVAATEHNT